MKYFLKFISRLSQPISKDGLLVGRKATIAIAGGLSLVTLTASLYLFIFAGRTLLPPPPIPDLGISRVFDPVPLRTAAAAPAPATEAPAATAPETAFPAGLPFNLPFESPSLTRNVTPVSITAAPVSPNTGTVASVPVASPPPSSPTVAQVGGDSTNGNEGSDSSGQHWPSAPAGRCDDESHATANRIRAMHNQTTLIRTIRTLLLRTANATRRKPAGRAATGC